MQGSVNGQVISLTLRMQRHTILVWDSTRVRSYRGYAIDEQEQRNCGCPLLLPGDLRLPIRPGHGSDLSQEFSAGFSWLRPGHSCQHIAAALALRPPECLMHKFSPHCTSHFVLCLRRRASKQGRATRPPWSADLFPTGSGCSDRPPSDGHR